MSAYGVCAECGKEFTQDEWEVRHSNDMGDDVHELCCRLCEEVAALPQQEEPPMATITYDDPFADAEVTEEKFEPIASPASEKQVRFLFDLMDRHDVPDNIRDSVRKEIEANTLEKRQASNYIDQFVKLPRRDAPKTGEPPEGMHILPDGRIYKVQLAHHGSGRPYAKRLDFKEEGRDGTWIYVGRNQEFRELSEQTKMTLEQAKAWGRLYGVCCKCGAILTDETSIQNGIGPICGSKGW